MHARTTARSLDRTFEILSHPYRRRILFILRSRSPRDVGDFSTDALGVDTDPATLQTSLHHNHLPKLAETEFIEWNRTSDTVRRGPRFDDAVPVLQLIEEQIDLPTTGQ